LLWQAKMDHTRNNPNILQQAFLLVLLGLQG
jgi:hypothetical protein